MRNIFDVFHEIDKIDNEEILDAQLAELKDPAIMKVFWEQRKIFLTETDPLIRKKAQLKCQMINKMYGAHVPIKKAINKFATPHGLTGIHISVRAKIGTGCTLFQHVVIGANTLPDSKTAGFPTVGKNVYFGAGSMVIGSVRIGDNCRIGANCIITKDIPDNCLVIQGDCKVIPRTEIMDNKFLYLEGFKKAMEEKGIKI